MSTMIRSRSKRDPPSAASIILENDAAAPTISLNARQREMLANRDRRSTDAESFNGRPLASRSNRGREPEPAQQFSSKENSRSLMGPNSRAKHSLASNRSALRGKASAPAEDPSRLRRILEQANLKSRLPRPGSRAASSTRQLARTDSDPQGSHVQETSRSVSTGHASLGQRDSSEKRNFGFSRGKDKESLIDLDRISSIRQSAEVESAANSSKDVSVNRSISVPRSRDSQSVNSASSSVRMKLEERRKLAQGKMRPSSASRIRGDSSASLSTASKVSTAASKRSMSIFSGRSVSVKSISSEESRAVESEKPPRAAEVGTRKLIGERMRQRRGGAARARENEKPKEEDQGFQDFYKTLRNEALESNSHVSSQAALVSYLIQ